MAQAFVTNLSVETVVMTHYDTAGDVRAALEPAGLYVTWEGPVDVPDCLEGVLHLYQFAVVQMPGNLGKLPISPSNAAVMLSLNSDIEVVNEQAKLRRRR